MLLFSCNISDNHHGIVLGFNIHIPDFFIIESIHVAHLRTTATTMQFSVARIVSGTNSAANWHPALPIVNGLQLPVNCHSVSLSVSEPNAVLHDCYNFMNFNLTSYSMLINIFECLVSKCANFKYLCAPAELRKPYYTNWWTNVWWTLLIHRKLNLW
jgi:hypothetical protein